jgi:fused signal recognition particle receptor
MICCWKCSELDVTLAILQVAATASSPFSKLGQVLREKARGDFERVFKGTEKTRQKLSVVDELLTYWNIDEADDQLEELEDALICVDFGPKTAFKITDEIRDKILKGRVPPASNISNRLHARTFHPALLTVYGSEREREAENSYRGT